jgi:hypothetical protein
MGAITVIVVPLSLDSTLKLPPKRVLRSRMLARPTPFVPLDAALSTSAEIPLPSSVIFSRNFRSSHLTSIVTARA